jgi:hypothetical protein
MQPPKWVYIATGVAIVVILLVFIGRRYWRTPDKQTTAAPQPAINVVAVPPVANVVRSDKIVASLINNLNADMRSLEIGRWFFKRLRAQTLAQAGTAAINCGNDYFNLAAIADAVPGANDVTKAATAKALRVLVDEAKRPHCGGGAAMKDIPRDTFIKTLNEFEALALAPGRGVLLGMPGYSEKSRLPLPS